MASRGGAQGRRPRLRRELPTGLAKARQRGRDICGGVAEARHANEARVRLLIKVKTREMCKGLAETLTYRCTCSSRSQPGHL